MKSGRSYRSTKTVAAHGHMNGRGPLPKAVGGTRSKTEVFVTCNFWNEDIN
jgi:hypothetical protein